jgi:hypothetical protein
MASPGAKANLGGQFQQKAVELYFWQMLFAFCFFARQKKAAFAPGAWPKRKPRGGESAVSVSKGALFGLGFTQPPLCPS